MSEEGDDKLLGLLGKMMGNIARSAVENARLLQEVSGTRADTASTCLPSTERVPAVAPQAYPHLSATSVDQAFGVSDAVNGYSGNEKGKRGRKRKGGAEVRAAARPRTHGRGSRTPRPARTTRLSAACRATRPRRSARRLGTSSTRRSSGRA